MNNDLFRPFCPLLFCRCGQIVCETIMGCTPLALRMALYHAWIYVFVHVVSFLHIYSSLFIHITTFCEYTVESTVWICDWTDSFTGEVRLIISSIRTLNPRNLECIPKSLPIILNDIVLRVSLTALIQFQFKVYLIANQIQISSSCFLGELFICVINTDGFRLNVGSSMGHTLKEHVTSVSSHYTDMSSQWMV